MINAFISAPISNSQYKIIKACMIKKICSRDKVRLVRPCNYDSDIYVSIYPTYVAEITLNERGLILVFRSTNICKPQATKSHR